MAIFVSGGILNIQPSTGPLFLMTKVSYGDFALKANSLVAADNNIAGIAFFQQAKNSTSYYLFKYKGGADLANLYLVNAGVSTLLDSCTFTKFISNAWNSLEVHAQGGWISVMFNGQTILSAYDTTFTSGLVGMYAEQNAQFKNFTMPMLYEDISPFTIGAGQDFATNAQNLLAIKTAYGRINFSGVFTVTIPSQSDPSVYGYQNEIVQNVAAQSDVEPYDQIIVYGLNGSSGSAFNQAQINAHGGEARINIITDETLLNNQQCIARAQRELTIAQRYAFQPQIDASVNAGLELFDYVTIVDAGQNLSTAYRVMNLTTTYDVESSKYSQSLDLAST